MRDVTAICKALAGWAKRWELSAPRLSAGWIDMPNACKPLIRDGWVERAMLEPPANAADEAAVVAATGLALPDDLRGLHAVHDGKFAPRLPAGMSMASYATTPMRWRSFADLGDDDGAEPEGTHVETAFDRGCEARCESFMRPCPSQAYRVLDPGLA